MPRAMAQRNEHLAQRTWLAPHTPARCVAPENLLIPQPFENALRCVALLVVQLLVVFKDLSIHVIYGPSFFDTGRSLPPIARRNRKLEHLVIGVPMTPKRFAAPGCSARPPSPRVVSRHRVPL